MILLSTGLFSCSRIYIESRKCKRVSTSSALAKSGRRGSKCHYTLERCRNNLGERARSLNNACATAAAAGRYAEICMCACSYIRIIQSGAGAEQGNLTSMVTLSSPHIVCVSACNIDDASNGVVNKISIIVIPERRGKTPRRVS
jgi:hypothetical protein